jgi:hypothetical protein
MYNNLLVEVESSQSQTRKVIKKSNHHTGSKILKVNQIYKIRGEKLGTKDTAQSKRALKKEDFN